MLDLGDEPSLTDVSWDALELKARLPEAMKEFFERKGLAPIHPDSRRAFVRYYSRGKAVFLRQDVDLGVYAVDTSRQGMRFISPVQLLPMERGRIRLPNARELQVQIVRCRRIGDDCYDCGAKFVLGS